MGTALRRWSSAIRPSATFRCISIPGIRAPVPRTNVAWATCSTCRARQGCRGRCARACLTRGPLRYFTRAPDRGPPPEDVMPLHLATEVVTLKTKHPFVIARGGGDDYRVVWVRLTDADGAEGWGEADPSKYYGETADTVLAVLRRLEPHLPKDAFELEAAEARFAQVVPKNGAARAALSAALHDLFGKRLGQPLPPEDLEGIAAVRRCGILPVVVDESCLVAADIPRMAAAADGINIKLAKCGSLREALRMIATARAHSMLVMVGCMIESSLGITAAAHFTPLVDAADLDGAALTANDPFSGATIDGGKIRLPTGPGLGVRKR